LPDGRRVKKTPAPMYTDMEMVMSSCAYVIDTFIEHTRLLDNVIRGCCALSKTSIPDRHEEFFEPYLIESMEFEFVNLKENRHTFDYRTKEEKLLSQRLKNLKIGPVNQVFYDHLMNSLRLVRSIKGIVEFVYLILFARNSQSIRSMISDHGGLQVAGGIVCCLLSLI